MSFAEALRRCFDRAFTFSGRASRAEYWWFVLFWVLSFLTLAVVTALSLPPGMAAFAQAAFVLALAIPLMSVGFRRLQDTGRTGWYALTPVIAMAVASGGRLIGSTELEFAGRTAQIGIGVLLLIWYAAPGQPGPNAFGPPPRR